MDQEEVQVRLYQLRQLSHVARNCIPHHPDGNREVTCSGSGDTEEEQVNLLLISVRNRDFNVFVGFCFTNAGVCIFLHLQPGKQGMRKGRCSL